MTVKYSATVRSNTEQQVCDVINYNFTNPDMFGHRNKQLFIKAQFMAT